MSDPIDYKNARVAAENRRKGARPGRPPKRAADKQSCPTTVRWTPDELELLEARAEAAGVPVAAFVRLSTLAHVRAGDER